MPYPKSGYSKRLKSKHEADILFALEEKKAAYAEYRQTRAEMRELICHSRKRGSLLGTKEKETDRDM